MTPFLTALENGFRRARLLLWPIKKMLWIKLFFLYLLAGSCGSLPFGGGPSSNDKKEDQAKIEVNVDKSEADATGDSSASPPSQELPKELNPWIQTIKEYWEKHKNKVFLGLALIGVSIFVLGFLWLWFSSRCALVLVPSLVHKDVRFRAFWRDTTHLGNSFFLFRTALVLLPLFGLSVAVAFAYFNASNLSSVNSVFGIVGGVLGLVFVLIFWLLFYWLVDAFLPIVMYGKNQKSWAAFQGLLGFIRKNMGKAILYTFLYIAFSFAFSLALMMAVLFLGLFVGIPAGLLGGFAVTLMAEWGLIAKIVLGSVLVILGILLVFVLFLLLVVPLQTFMTYMRMELVASEASDLEKPLTPLPS